MERTTERIGVGIDVGGTFTKIAAVSDRGKMLRVLQVETAPQKGPKGLVRRIVRSVRELERSLERPISAAGVGLAGDVDSRKGILRFTPNMRPFGGFPFKKVLETQLKMPVRVDNDANAAAWGAYVVELRRRASNVVVVTMGTGIGGGVIVEGKLHQGSTGSAGEIGHTCVEPDGELCHCGNRGCLEAYAGSYGVVRTVQKMMACAPYTRTFSRDGKSRGRKSALLKLCPDLNRLEPRHIADAARRGDPVAKTAWQVAGYYLGIGVANAVRLLNPDVVILTGGVSKAGSLALSPALKFLRSRSMKTPIRHVRVRIAKTPNLGAIGAALWGLEAV